MVVLPNINRDSLRDGIEEIVSSSEKQKSVTFPGWVVAAITIPMFAFLLLIASSGTKYIVELIGATVAVVATAFSILTMLSDKFAVATQERKIEQIAEKAEKEPEKTKFAWDLARVKLEAYFDRNLSQVQMIFFVAVAVMVVGFVFILWGVNLAITKPEVIKTSYIAAASGIITEFIGVTFMVIYRSTMAQANQFMEVLERINTVGMAVQILDAIPEKETELKNTTRAEIVSLLLSVNARSKKTVGTAKEKTVKQAK